MAEFNFEDLDNHISNLRSQLSFLASALHSTDHTTQEWIATDLISLRNATGRLRDEMGVFQSKLDGEGLRTRKDGRKRARLSIEGAKAEEGERKGAKQANEQPTYPDLPTASTPPPRTQAENASTATAPTSDAPENEGSGAYTPQFLDISNLVEQRVHARRLQSLIDSPRTAQKRKRLEFTEEDTTFRVENEDEDPENDDRSTGGIPVKKVKSWGQFEQALKRKDGAGNGEKFDREIRENDGGDSGRKRQRI